MCFSVVVSVVRQFTEYFMCSFFSLHFSVIMNCIYTRVYCVLLLFVVIGYK